jgi:hypothetical protein
MYLLNQFTSKYLNIMKIIMPVFNNAFFPVNNVYQFPFQKKLGIVNVPLIVPLKDLDLYPIVVPHN